MGVGVGVGVGVSVGVGVGVGEEEDARYTFARGTSPREVTGTGLGVANAVAANAPREFAPTMLLRSSSLCPALSSIGSFLTAIAKSPRELVVVSILSHGMSSSEGFSSQKDTTSLYLCTDNRKGSPPESPWSRLLNRIETVTACESPWGQGFPPGP